MRISDWSSDVCSSDLLHDIPNTVAKAIQALRPLDPAIITIHASGGRAMLADAKAAAPSGTKVVAVTVLTSLAGEDLKSVGLNGNAHAQVERLADPAPARTAERRGGQEGGRTVGNRDRPP